MTLMTLLAILAICATAVALALVTAAVIVQRTKGK